jgi:hypothetical protein
MHSSGVVKHGTPGIRGWTPDRMGRAANFRTDLAREAARRN